MIAFPEHQWLPWKFKASPAGWWEKFAVKFHNDDKQAHVLIEAYIAELGRTFKISKLAEWYRIGESRLGWKRTHLEPLGGLAHVLEKVYPNHEWQRHLFRIRSKRSIQHLIYTLLIDKFPGKSMPCDQHAFSSYLTPLQPQL